MTPATPDVTHRLLFENVDGSGFEGAGLGPESVDDPILDSDPGLWVMGDGSMDLQGATRTGWTRDPDQAVGWEPSDGLRITSTEVEDFESRPWTMGNPIPQAYPDVPSAEVFNLTRNVVIAGTPSGNSHVSFVRTSRAASGSFLSSTWPPLRVRGLGDRSRGGPDNGEMGSSLAPSPRG